MTNKRTGKLSRQILGIIGISALLALILFMFLSGTANAITESYCFNNDIPMTEFDWLALDRWILSASMLISVCFFSILFLFLFADRIAYIRKITTAIEALHAGQQELSIPLEGNNELTQLAESINEMSRAQKQLRDKELALSREKEQLIRSLSHDIRTPLTSILAYSDYLSAQEPLSVQEQQNYFALIGRKARQIRELTDVLLEGGKRNPEKFEDARLLMAQLIDEFEESLDEQFRFTADLHGCPAFSGYFDIQELRRIFDNLSSNIRKYADPAQPVTLSVAVSNGSLVICQTNAVLPVTATADSYQLGIQSIRRIAQHYGGQVTVQQTASHFSIAVTLSEF